jgi:DNA-binding response OmpR family regulator
MQDESQHNEVSMGSEEIPITVGPITIDVSHLRVSVDGKTLSLTGLEGYILHYLAVHAHTICTDSQIGSGIWGSIDDGAIGLIRITIRHLRQKIEPDPMHPIYLLTVPEGGFMLVSHDQDETER